MKSFAFYFLLVILQQSFWSEIDVTSAEETSTPDDSAPLVQPDGPLNQPPPLVDAAPFEETSSNPAVADASLTFDQPRRSESSSGDSTRKRESLTKGEPSEIGETAKVGDDSSFPQVAALQGFPQSLPIGGRGSSLTRVGTGYRNFKFSSVPSCSLCSRERNLCQIISGIFTRTPLPYGYSLVTPIPSGVCNVSIVELKPSKNFFALRRPDSAYVLNGNWKIQAAGSYAIGGTIFDYSPADGNRGEKLQSPGPLLEPIDLMIIYQSPNPGIKYEYRVPLPDIVGQQPPSRSIPVSTNPASIGSAFGLKNPKASLTRHQPRILSGLRQNLVPNSRVSNTGVIPFPGQPGRHPLLSAKQPSLPSGNPNRPPFINTPQGPGLPLFPQRGKSGVDPPGKLPILNKNWGSSYIPPRSSSAGVSRTQNKELLQIPLNKSPPRQPGQRISSHFAASSSTQGILPQGEVKPLLPSGHFPGILNTDPKDVPFYPIPDTDISEASKTTTGSDFSSPSILGHSFTPRTTSVSSLPGGIEAKHHARHRHGSTNIVPGPAVGGNGLSLNAGNDLARNSFGTDGSSPARGGEKRRNRKKGKKKKGKRRRNRFIWVFKGLTECSKTCGGGNQTSVLSCVRRRKNKVVSDRLCKDVQKPENELVSCNLKPCPAKWVPGNWSTCSVSCGYGVQTRKLSCKQVVSQSLTLMVPEGACLGSKEEIDVNQVCNLEPCPIKEPHWDIGEWSQCSATCGTGVRTRSITCLADGKPVNDSLCLEQEVRPDDQEACHMGSCVVDLWYFSQWPTKCSETCGEGVQTRKVFCVTSDEDQESVSCPIESKPQESRSCVEYSDCGGTWFAGPWSECSVTCGSGRETRSVACLVNAEGKWKVASNGECQEELHPSYSRACILETCLPEWYTSEWNECSESCGGGLKERQVKCYDPDRRPSGDCYPATKPPAGDTCNTHRCPSFAPGGPPFNDSTQRFFDESSPHEGIQDEEVKKEEEKNAQASSLNQNSSTNAEANLPHLTLEPTTSGATPPSGDPKGEGTTTTPQPPQPPQGRDNTQSNELEVIEQQDVLLNVIPGKDSQGDESASDSQEQREEESKFQEEKERKKEERKKKKKKKEKRRKQQPHKNRKKANCIDRIKNCHLVFRARLCPLKYYNKLCCSTCQNPLPQ